MLLQERRLDLSSEGPPMVFPGGNLAHTLTLTNTTEKALLSLHRVNTLPTHTQIITCSRACSEAGTEKVCFSEPEPLSLRLSPAA
jgi:hypothetical protein